MADSDDSSDSSISIDNTSLLNNIIDHHYRTEDQSVPSETGQPLVLPFLGRQQHIAAPPTTPGAHKVAGSVASQDGTLIIGDKEHHVNGSVIKEGDETEAIFIGTSDIPDMITFISKGEGTSYEELMKAGLNIFNDIYEVPNTGINQILPDLTPGNIATDRRGSFASQDTSEQGSFVDAVLGGRAAHDRSRG